MRNTFTRLFTTRLFSEEYFEEERLSGDDTNNQKFILMISHMYTKLVKMSKKIRYLGVLA